MLCDELMDENEQEHIADIYERDRKTGVSLPPAPCVGESKEVRFRGSTLRTEHRDTEQNTETQRHRTEHRDKEHGVEGKVLGGLLSPVPCVGECNEVRYKGLDAAARMGSGREQ